MAGGGFFSAAPSAQNSQEHHFHFYKFFYTIISCRLSVYNVPNRNRWKIVNQADFVGHCAGDKHELLAMSSKLFWNVMILFTICLSLNINSETKYLILKSYSDWFKEGKNNHEKTKEILSNHHVTDQPSRIESRAKAGFKLYNFNLCKSKDIKSLFEILASYDSVICAIDLHSPCNETSPSYTTRISNCQSFSKVAIWMHLYKDLSHIVPAVPII